MKNHFPKFHLLHIVIAALLLFTSCAPQKATKEAKRNEEAVGRVLRNDELLKRVAKRLSGGNETITSIAQTKDSGSAMAPEKPAFLVDADSLCNNRIEAYRAGLLFATDKPLQYSFGRGIKVVIDQNGVKAWATQTDTTKTIIDRRLADAWRDSSDVLRERLIKSNMELAHALQQANILKESNYAASATIDSLKQIIIQKDAPKKKGLRWYWWLAIALVTIGIIAAFVGSKALPWVAVVKAITALFGFLKKKNRYDTIAPVPIPAPKPVNGYYRLYPFEDGWQYQRVADNNRATTTSQKYDDRSSALAGIVADRKLFNLPVKEAKGPLPA